VIAQRSQDELRHMRAAGRVVAEMHERIRAAAAPGVTTAHLDGIGRDVIDRRGARSNFLGYHGYPAVICASVNEVVIHGIPGPQVLQEGDLLSVDCGAIVQGWHADAAFSMGIGEIDDESRRLIETADAALAAAIGAMLPANHLGDVGHAIEHVVRGAGFSGARDYCGHGIGRQMHEDPDVHNYGRPGKGPRLRPGNVLAIEPMVCAGRSATVVRDDGWTVVTTDRRRAAHAEHTVLVTDSVAEVLTGRL